MRGIEYKLRHDLFVELEAFDPAWQQKYRRIGDAAAAAGAQALYRDWLRTEHGQHYLSSIASAHDHQADNEFRRAQRHAELVMAARGRQAGRRGYVTEEDQV